MKKIWTFEKCKEEVQKYKSKKELRLGNQSAYNSIIKNNWDDVLFKNLIEESKPNNYWTYERCKKEALKYNKRSDFRNNSIGASASARKNGWYEDICSHMDVMLYPDNYWTYERCKEESLKYNTKIEFLKGNYSAYCVVQKNKWFDSICYHMDLLRKPNGYYTYEKCKEIALKYEYKIDFKRNEPGAYRASRKNGWYEDICSHMKIIGDKYKRCIYIWKFEDDSIYVGLSCNLKRRIDNHKNNETSQVFKHLKICKGVCLQITDYIDVKDAQLYEKNYIDYYKGLGYNILNKTKGGEIGIPKNYKLNKN